MSDYTDLSLIATKELISELSERCDNTILLRETIEEKNDEYRSSRMKHSFSFSEPYVRQCFDGDTDKAAIQMMAHAVATILGGQMWGDTEPDKFKT